MTSSREKKSDQRAVAVSAPGTLYQGTSGIALFLIELYRVTGDSRMARTAEGALEYALRGNPGWPTNRFGFYGGRVGVAYASARIGRLVNKNDYLDKALEILKSLAGNADQDASVDLMAGSAGAIPALVELAPMLEATWIMDVAIELGDHLVSEATREPIGWSWDAMSTLPRFRNLTGFAHGAAGIGHALAVLYGATGIGKYEYAAEQAFLYEDQFHLKNESNWLDLRHRELGQVQHEGRIADLRQSLLEGSPPPPSHPKCMTAWCYGAPGIALSRLSAYQILGHPSYLTKARSAIDTTLASLGTGKANYSLCHGEAGNCEPLLYGAQVLGEPSLKAFAEECGLQGWEDYESGERPWPCGTIGAVTDPSLMLGEAGIGFFYLRLANPETPSVLIIAAGRISGTNTRERQSYESQCQDHVEHFFARTLSAIEHLEPDESRGDRQLGRKPSPDRSPVVTAFEQIESLIDSEGDSGLRELLRDAFGLESARYDRALNPVDFTDQFLASLVGFGPQDKDLDSAVFELVPGNMIVASAYDWDEWAMKPREQKVNPPELRWVKYLVGQNGSHIHLRRLSGFAALILEVAKKQTGLSEILAAVKNALDVSEQAEARQVRDAVERQISEAVKAGILICRSNIEV